MNELKGTPLDYILQKYFAKELTEIETIIEISKYYNLKTKKAPIKECKSKILSK